MDLTARLNAMEAAIKKPSFRQSSGKANEVNYWIFDYPPEKELEVRERIEYMKNKNLKGNDEYKLVVFDLYDIIIDFLDRKNFVEKCCDFEKKRGFGRIVKAVSNSMKVSEDDSLIVRHIQENTPENAIVFLTGVGKSYPLLRSHNVLNNLHQSYLRAPVVMFFPGTYNEQELILFNEIISIEDFARRVKSYIDRKGNNHHVVFLVDEIGQYIGEDSKLMLNLQTVTEELGKECMGKAWVIVTSQQDIDSITKVKGNDFSKIQGRFDTRLSLSSANVDAVIKKRILEKTDAAAQSLRLLYEQKATIIKNLIVFNDTAEKKLYANETDFAEVYPFVPYQFNLLSSVLTSIRTHGASGKHLSGGERSMLALFKESAVNIMNEEMGVIVPFHRFYDALENFLDHSHSGVIIRAYDNSYINPEKKDKDVFAINVLKTLFMIKYVLEIEANIDNITSLMIENIDDDRIELKGRVEDALKVLMRQMLVQKNGSIYVFLTDEEQEVNNEIEKENVETPEIITKVSEMIFEDIFPGKKYIYPAFNGRYAFLFNQAVDDRPYKANQSYDVGVRILTPWYDGSTDDATLRMMSGQGKEVLVVLPGDAEFLKEIQSYLKIEGFLRKNTSTQLAKYETIKEAKRVEMRERNANAKLYLTEALKEATIYVNGDVARVSGKEVGTRINEAIGRLVQTVYHKLSYIDTPMGEAEIRKLLHTSNQLSLGLEGGTESNAHALDDVQGFISLNTRNHMKTSMKSVKDRFMKAPYSAILSSWIWLLPMITDFK